MISLKFEIDGDTQVARALSRFGDEIKDLRPAFREIAKNFKQIEARQFATEGRGGWPQLSPNYAAWKMTNFPGTTILRATGLLLASLTGGSQYVERMDRMNLVLGTQVSYAIYHQRGVDGRMPQRRVIDLTESDKMGWMKILQRFAVNQAKKAGLQ